jgi:peptide/nickel transport system substrate-binding protein
LFTLQAILYIPTVLYENNLIFHKTPAKKDVLQMKQLLKMKFFVVSTLFAVLISCIGCSKKQDDAAVSKDNSGFPRAKTLYIGGIQWGDPNTFNPLHDWPAWPVGGNFNLMYEPLLVYNTMNGKTESLLANSYQQADDFISVVLNPAAKWSDGKALTSEDVKYTYELGLKYKNAPTSYVLDYISKITVDSVADSSSGQKLERVNFYINKEVRNNPLAILDFFMSIRIVPKHFMEELIGKAGGQLAEMQKMKVDSNPVVSGPYTLHSYSGEKIVLKRRDDYWGNTALHGGKLPQPQYVVHPIFKSNDHYNIALSQGELDISQTFIPRVWMKAKDGVRTWYSKAPFYVPASIPMLTLNCLHYPLSDKIIRRAMAFAVDYNNLKEVAVSGYSPELKAGLVLPFGLEAPYFSDEDAQKYGAKFDTATARKLLKDAGYVSEFDKDGNLLGMKNKKGEPVPTMYIKSPAGWTDWETMVKLVVKDLRAVGIDVREGFCDAGSYFQSQPTGDFDIIMGTPTPNVTPSKPWSRFENIMSSRNWKPQGEKMNENQGRYNNPKSKDYNAAVDSLIKVIPTIKSEDEKVKAYRALNKIYMEDQPTLPLVYKPEQFYQFSVKCWTNFPTEENQYGTPQCVGVGAGSRTLWEIKPVSGK